MNVENIVSQELSVNMDESLATPLVKRFYEIKRAFHLHDYERMLGDAGKFAEIVFHYIRRLLHESSSQTLGSINNLVKRASSLGQQFPHSIRIHIPRLMHIVYGFRSKDGGAHWSPGVSPGISEAKVVWAMISYTMIEITRFVTRARYDKIAEHIQRFSVANPSPVEMIDGKPHVNIPNISALKSIILLLHNSLSGMMRIQEIQDCLSEFTKKNIKESMRRALKKKLVKDSDGTLFITSLGTQFAEEMVGGLI